MEIEMNGPFTLRVAKNELNRFAPDNDGILADTGTLHQETGFLNVIHNNDINTIRLYGKKIAWVADLCDAIFGIDTNNGGRGKLWFRTDANHTPNLLQPTDMVRDLGPGIYEFHRPTWTTGPFTVIPTKGFSRSRFWQGPRPEFLGPANDRHARFATRVKQRDVNCVISNCSGALVASHLIPNRVPPNDIVNILRRYNRTPEAIPTTGWGPTGTDANNDERIGVLAFKVLDEAIDDFRLGFYCPDPVNHPNEYEVQLFKNNCSDYNVLGITNNAYNQVRGAGNNQLQSLHGLNITFADSNGVVRPLDAAIRWHYMQCVLRNLATDEYQVVPIW
jgi:hypothetical protein